MCRQRSSKREVQREETEGCSARSAKETALGSTNQWEPMNNSEKGDWHDKSSILENTKYLEGRFNATI